MNINYGDSNLIVDYIQMFLREYYSKFIKFESKYTKELHQRLIEYLNSFDSLDMSDLIEELSRYPQLFQLFNLSNKIDEILLIAKQANPKKIPATGNNPVDWMNKNLFASEKYNEYSSENLETFLLKRGWHIVNYNYRNTNDRCEILIKKLNKNVIPKEDVYNLINMYDNNYTEMSFATTTRTNSYNIQTYDNVATNGIPGKYHFSNLYNYEAENFNESNENLIYRLQVPSINKIIVNNQRVNKYEITKDSSNNYIISLSASPNTSAIFKGFKTFSINLHKDKNNNSQYYNIYIKRPNNYKFIPDSDDDTFYLYHFYSFDLNYKSHINYQEYNDYKIESPIINSYEISESSGNWIDSEYLCLTIKINIPDNSDLSIEDYKFCISFYDPDNEINSILAYKLNNSDIKDNLKSYLNNSKSKSVLVDPSNLDANSSIYFKTNLITPKDYYENPFAISDKLLSYILEAVVHKYSRESDILMIQKLAQTLGYKYDKYEYAVYNDDLKEFIKKLQLSININNKLTNGDTDPETEHFLNLSNNKIGGI